MHILLQARELRVGGHVDKAVGTLLYHIATRFRGSQERAAMLAEYVCEGKVNTEVQLTGEGEGRGGRDVLTALCLAHHILVPMALVIFCRVVTLGVHSHLTLL